MKLYDWLLTLYPKSFRNEYGDELRSVFRRRRDAASGPFAIAWLWFSELIDVAANASRVHLDILRQDLRFSVRSIRRTPGFFFAAVTVTALGIGATTAAFTLTDHVLLRPLPYPDVERLVKIWESNPSRPVGLRGIGGTNDVAPANYRDWKQLSSSFEMMGAYSFMSANLVGRGDPERLNGVSVTPEVLRVIGVAPAMGRMFEDADNVRGAPCAVIVSDALRRQRFQPGETVIGEKILLNDEPCSIAGVMPPGFAFPTRDLSFWIPIRLGQEWEQRNNNYLRVVAKLKPGIAVAQASADLARVSALLEQRYPAENKDVSAAVILLRDEVGDPTRTMLYAVAGASACLLLIACTNLASLFFARATARSRELSVRMALGAGAERLVRQLLTDTAAIAAAGTVLGILIASGVLPLAVKLVPTTLPVGDAPPVDWRMLSIAVGAALITVLTCGVVPAIRATRQVSSGGLREGARAGTSRRTERMRALLVTAQVAASVALLVCTALLLRALWRVQSIETGFETDGVLTMRLNLPYPEYAPAEKRLAFHRRVLEDVAALPDVQEAAFTSYLPLTMRGGVWSVYRAGEPPRPGQAVQSSLVRFVTPRYFDVMSIPLRDGRVFDDRDSLSGELTAVVSENFGKRMWPGESPIGRRFAMLGVDRTVIGVVGEIKVRGVERSNEPQVYLHAAQHPNNVWGNYASRDLAVKTKRDLSGRETGELAASIRSIVAKADPRLPVSDVRPLSAIVENDFAFRSVQAQVLRAFAIVAVVLAGVGLHGLLAFMVSARTREIGVRLALGAARRDILGMVLGRGLKLALLGGVVGLGAGYFIGTSFRAVLAGVDPADAAAFAGAVAVAVAMTLGGSLWPALKAARTDLMTATRTE